MTIATLQSVALTFSLYWYVWWYDLVMHFLGGMFSVLLAVWFCFFSGYTPFSRPTALLRFVVLSAIVIGGGWEVFERVFGSTWSPEGYYLDTGIDIVMDTSGGIVAYLLFLLPERAKVPEKGELAPTVGADAPALIVNRS